MHHAIALTVIQQTSSCLGDPSACWWYTGVICPPTYTACGWFGLVFSPLYTSSQTDIHVEVAPVSAHEAWTKHLYELLMLIATIVAPWYTKTIKDCIWDKQDLSAPAAAWKGWMHVVLCLCFSPRPHRRQKAHILTYQAPLHLHKPQPVSNALHGDVVATTNTWQWRVRMAPLMWSGIEPRPSTCQLSHVSYMACRCRNALSILG